MLNWMRKHWSSSEFASLESLSGANQSPSPSQSIWNAPWEISGLRFLHSRVELDSVSLRDSLRGVRRGRTGRRGSGSAHFETAQID